MEEGVSTKPRLQRGTPVGSPTAPSPPCVPACPACLHPPPLLRLLTVQLSRLGCSLPAARRVEAHQEACAWTPGDTGGCWPPCSPPSSLHRPRLPSYRRSHLLCPLARSRSALAGSPLVTNGRQQTSSAGWKSSAERRATEEQATSSEGPERGTARQPSRAAPQDQCAAWLQQHGITIASSCSRSHGFSDVGCDIDAPQQARQFERSAT
jgi:hypothetical protein